MPRHSNHEATYAPAPSAGEISATLLELYRIYFSVLPESKPERQGRRPGAAATIGTQMLECVRRAAEADGGALLLAHLPAGTGPWLAPGELGRASVHRTLALRHAQVAGLFADTATHRQWLRLAMPLASAEHASAPGAEQASESAVSQAATGASHLVLALSWLETPQREQTLARARVLLAAIGEGLCSGVNVMLWQELHDDLVNAVYTNEELHRRTELANAEWQQVFDAIVDPICVVDTSYRIVRANAAYRAHFADDTAPLERYRCYEALERKSSPCEGCPLPQALGMGQPSFRRREYVAPGRIGDQTERRAYEVWSYPVPTPTGEVAHAVEVVRDVTERERLQEVAASVEELRTADRLKAELLGTVSHELRSPLAAIKGYAATLLRHERRLGREERHEFLRAIVEGSDRLEVLISQLLEMSELSTGTVTLRRESLDVAPLIRDAIEQCERTRPGDVVPHEFVLAIESAGSAVASGAPRVSADPRLLRNVLDNLLDNAVNFTPAGGMITVRVDVRPAGPVTPVGGKGAPEAPTQQVPALATPALEIAVHDNGVGIPADHLGRIFDQFHRVDTRLTREVDGLGLGLAICQRIVELHGGAIWAESAPGAGSTFHVLLPLENQTGVSVAPVVSV
jgi:signal transduction histidine kinase